MTEPAKSRRERRERRLLLAIQSLLMVLGFACCWDSPSPPRWRGSRPPWDTTRQSSSPIWAC
ncbi:hypothetical protein ACFQYP_65125 [Nonomuraea antimicrobica]